MNTIWLLIVNNLPIAAYEDEIIAKENLMKWEEEMNCKGEINYRIICVPVPFIKIEDK